MARMIPTQQPSVRSESMVFNVLKNGYHTRGWTVFYSLHVPIPDRPPREIDFLVIIPEYFSFICLEVKGGRYDIEKGGWYPLESSGNRKRKLSSSPHKQARDTMFALKDYCGEEKLGGFEKRENLSLGCAVAFTDMSKPSSPITFHEADSIWSNDVQDPDKLYEKLEEIAKKMCSIRGPKNKTEKEKADQYLADIQEELEGPTVKDPENRIYSSDLDTLRKELLVLTNDQLRSLGIVKRNACCVIDGAAGTGKTVLAMELARQLCEEKGEKVALICSNPYLSSRFVRWAKTLSSGSDGKVVAGILKDFSRLYRPKQKKFDYLIVDEAQNLCDQKSLKSMDNLLKGGLTNGNWAMFGDFTYQNIINPNINKTGEEVLEKLKKIYPRITHDELEINCRNTYEIAAAASMFLRIDSLPRSGVHGPLIQTKYFKTQEQLNNLLDELVTDFKDRKFLSRQIILLSGSSDNFKTLLSRQFGGWRLLNVLETEGKKDLDRENVPDVSGDSSKKTLRYSDIHDFQGLESEVVFLVIPLTEKQTKVGGSATLPDYGPLKRVLYVGMSRAKAILIIVAEESYKGFLELEPHSRKSYENRIEELITQSKS